MRKHWNRLFCSNKIKTVIVVMVMLLSLVVLNGNVSYAEGTSIPDDVVIDEDHVQLEDGYLTVDEGEDSYDPITSEYLRSGMAPPSSYDLRNVNGNNYLTTVKNQGSYGTCWAFSALGVAESNQLRRTGISNDLSEYQLAYFLYNHTTDPLGNTEGDSLDIIDPNYNYLTLGATNLWGMFELAGWIGPVGEDVAPYATSTANKTPLDAAYAYKKDSCHMQNARVVSMANDTEIKKMIMNEDYGPCVVGIHEVFGSSLYYDSTNRASYQSDTSCNHGVVIVGWDDNFSRTKFNSNFRPSRDGAWLVRNSWGSNYDYSWISYQDAAIKGQKAIFYSYEASDNYDFNYQYDGGSSLSYLTVDNGYTFINKFTTVGAAAENLKAVSFALRSDNVDYTIQIYKNSSDDNPLDGEALLHTPIRGTTTYIGYYTIPVEEEIVMHQGDTFAVAITFSDQDDNEVKMYIDRSYEDSPVRYVSHTEANQSYYVAPNSGIVYDAGSNKSSPFCPRIKAFTSVATDAHIHSYTQERISPEALKSAATTTSPAIYYYSCSFCGAVNKSAGAATFTYGDRLAEKIKVSYKTHVQTYGWQDWKSDGVTSGTTGEAKRLEGIQIKISGNPNLGITYRTHVQTYGWQDWRVNGTTSGTEGEAKRLEAIAIKLTGPDADKYDVYYRVHAQSYGWLGWAKNGEYAGTAGQAKRLEGIQIMVVSKGEQVFFGNIGYSYVELGKSAKNSPMAGKVNYMTHVQSYGNQSYVYDGSISGTQGEAKRLEGICIQLNEELTQVPGGITYRTHVQTYGWLNWSGNGVFNGTHGQAKRLEAIEIKLTGKIAEQYDVYYRVHAQTFGWLGWAKNGQTAGTEGLSKRLEGIQIVLVPKGGYPPTDALSNTKVICYKGR